MSKAMPSTVIVVLFDADLGLAEKIAREIGGTIHVRGCNFSKITTHCRSLFARKKAIIFIGASGIIIRALAPLLQDKWNEPPVVVVSACGRAVIPLLGGHHGANALARKIGDIVKTRAAITTAGDIHLRIALDEPPKGWRLENPQDAGLCAAALIAGAPAKISGFADWLNPLGDRVKITSQSTDDNLVILSVSGCESLIYRKQNYVLGVGCARGCDADELIGLVAKTLAAEGISTFALHSVHSIDVKADEAAIHALGAHFDIDVRFHDPEALCKERPRLLNPSEVVFAAVGCYGVAESAALAASGDDGTLVIAKHKSSRATCALARGTDGAQGIMRGRLSVIGIGPGQSAWRTPEATRHIEEADILVGYGFYLDLLEKECFIAHKIRKDFALGEEEARCRYGLETAAKGKKVALICSGDGGIYAMGALVMELFARTPEMGGVSPDAKRVEICHITGISALQAASARAGAVLGHDFCAISLSDLLTARETILKRLKAAADGDFVIALYNPVSMRRRTLLLEARDIILTHRSADTPVVIATSLGRAQEHLHICNLKELDVDKVDMMSVILIGSSATKRILSGDKKAGIAGEWLFTPRGYERKIDGDMSK